VKSKKLFLYSTTTMVKVREGDIDMSISHNIAELLAGKAELVADQPFSPINGLDFFTALVENAYFPSS
jgi:hypothetical protein